MFKKIAQIIILTTLVCATAIFAASRQELRIVPNARSVGVTHPDSTVRVEWIQMQGAGSQTPTGEPPIETWLYVSRTPSGGDLSRYTRLPNIQRNPTTAGGSIPAEYALFVPSQQGGAMRPGVYYLIVAGFTEEGDTLYSDYQTVMVESQRAPTIVSPRGNLMTGQMFATIDNHTPTLRWTAGDANVPYYHVLLVEGAIVDDGGNPLEKVNVIWQAITSNTSITYGAPDPSGTITASPPPLTPGKRYSWMVLNNYGNHMAFTSNVFNAVDLLLGQFEISGTRGVEPQVIAPDNDADFNYNDNENLEFSFTNLDPNANSFLINLFSHAGGNDLGVSGLGEISAGILIWETTVSKGSHLELNDVIKIPFDAAGTLTGGSYSWRVHAIRGSGAASTGDASVGTFNYRAQAGKLQVSTKELIGGAEFNLGFTELSVEVIAGPTQAPLALFTDMNGNMPPRDFPVGTYRITAQRDGFTPRTVTVNIREGQTETVNFALSRPEATIFGRVLSAADNSAINLARVTAVSEWGDTIITHTDGQGSFTLNTRAATWNISVDMAGHQQVTHNRVTVRSGENRDLGNITLTRNPFTLTGTIRNAAHEPITGARVRVFSGDGALIDELASTAQNGIYSFHLARGSYVITVERSGFVMWTRGVDITGSRSLDVTMQGGAAVVNGTITGIGYVPPSSGTTYSEVRAPITSARIRFFEDGARDTFTVVSDPVFGQFTISLPHDRKYNVLIDAAGFDAGSISRDTITTGARGETQTFNATVRAFAMIRGRVTAGGSGLANVDVLIAGSDGRAVATGTTDAQGNYEVRNIPNGRYTARAGRVGYYTNTTHNLNLANGRPTTSNGGAVLASYDFAMSEGNTNISWSVGNTGYRGGGSVNILSPLNASVPFAANTATLENVGPGRYIFEADPGELHPELLILSRREINVSASTENAVEFSMSHTPVDAITKHAGGQYAGQYTFEIEQVRTTPNAYITKISLHHRSEGSSRWSVRDTTFTNTTTDAKITVSFTPDRDGTNLQYYFEITMSNGDVYGSPKQFYTAYVNPDQSVVTKFSLTPGDVGDDTLVLPSSYEMRFVATAFISDLFIEVGDLFSYNNSITYEVLNSRGAREGTGRGRNFNFETPATAQNLTLRAMLDLSQSAEFTKKDGMRDTIEIPLRVTGQTIASMTVRRQGDEVPIVNTATANFSLDARDGNDNPVTLTPRWSVFPARAGTMSASGEFTPNADFFGTAQIRAHRTQNDEAYIEYVTGEGERGLDVRYVLRRQDVRDSVSAFDDQMRLRFLPNAIAANETAEFSVSVPDLRNLIIRGSTDYRMADSMAFELVNSSPELLDSMYLVFPIPQNLRGGGRDLRVARWSAEDLKWIPLATSELTADGTAAVAKLTNSPASLSRSSSLFETAAPSSNSNAMTAEAACEIVGTARYALVVRSNRFDISVNVSPHPFSPHIRPTIEHGMDAREGTRISVDVEAPEPFVRSVQVHIYNATGQLVWAIIDQNAITGVTHYWWNGRTSVSGNSRSAVRELPWNNEMSDDNTRNRPLVRNGRYFVTVIVTDMEGNKRRVRRPVVVLK